MTECLVVDTYLTILSLSFTPIVEIANMSQVGT